MIGKIDKTLYVILDNAGNCALQQAQYSLDWHDADVIAVAQTKSMCIDICAEHLKGTALSTWSWP